MRLSDQELSEVISQYKAAGFRSKQLLALLILLSPEEPISLMRRLVTLSRIKQAIDRVAPGLLVDG